MKIPDSLVRFAGPGLLSFGLVGLLDLFLPRWLLVTAYAVAAVLAAAVMAAKAYIELRYQRDDTPRGDGSIPSPTPIGKLIAPQLGVLVGGLLGLLLLT